MPKVKKIPKVLFIKGVFKKDCMTDDIFDKKIMESISEDNRSISFLEQDDLNLDYVKLPNTFEHIDAWPKSTNLLCWNCHQSFNGIPVFIPSVIEPITTKESLFDNKRTMGDQKFVIGVYGIFSSFGCAFSYIDTHNYTLTERIEMYNKLNLLHKLFYGTKIKDISYFPSIFNTKPYGGNMNLDEFRMEMEKYKKENICLKA